jgi:hypothetical protein
MGLKDLSIDELIEIIENSPESVQAEMDAICREALPDAIQVLFDIAHDPECPAKIRAQAVEGLIKHGLLGTSSDRLH